MRFVKLVRDQVTSKSDVVEYAPIADRDEYLSALRKKLCEEVAEYLEERTVDELADIFEVVTQLAYYAHGIFPTAFQSIAAQKHGIKGGFGKCMGLFLKREGED